MESHLCIHPSCLIVSHPSLHPSTPSRPSYPITPPLSTDAPTHNTQAHSPHISLRSTCAFVESLGLSSVHPSVHLIALISPNPGATHLLVHPSIHSVSSHIVHSCMHLSIPSSIHPPIHSYIRPSHPTPLHFFKPIQPSYHRPIHRFIPTPSHFNHPSASIPCQDTPSTVYSFTNPSAHHTPPSSLVKPYLHPSILPPTQSMSMSSSFDVYDRPTLGATPLTPLRRMFVCSG
jgi:hypothetical protein